jgi:hypothetical protein
MTWSFVNHQDAEKSAPNADRAPDLADEFAEIYLRWREESAAVQLAYERWRAAPADDTAHAYAAYHAALDLEERAATVFCECAARVSATGQV